MVCSLIKQSVCSLLSENNMTQYQPSTQSGLLRSTAPNIINCTYPFMKLRIIHELWQDLISALITFSVIPCSAEGIWNHE